MFSISISLRDIDPLKTEVLSSGFENSSVIESIGMLIGNLEFACPFTEKEDQRKLTMEQWPSG